MKICHVTSAHKSEDTRIFYKECVSLADAGHQVFLVAPGKNREENGVRVVGVGEKPVSRFKRMFSFSKKVYKTALSLDCDVYHLHDPELLFFGMLFKRHGKMVVYDSHEDYPSTVRAKGYLPALLRPLISWLVKKFELFACSKFDAVICCYHWTKERLAKVCELIDLVFNFPIINENAPVVRASNGTDQAYVCYAGGISKQWNIDKLIQSLTLCPGTRLKLAGRISENKKSVFEKLAGWKSVDYFGELPFHQVIQTVYSDSIAGMALLDYIPQCNYTVGNLSNTKLFEYMYAGLPVICTDFDLWKSIIDKHKCGIYVNPHNEQEIAKAICFLKDNSDEREKMGERSRKAVMDEYNWSSEEAKLLQIYLVLERKTND